jgi:hypothetical protein
MLIKIDDSLNVVYLPEISRKQLMVIVTLTRHNMFTSRLSFSAPSHVIIDKFSRVVTMIRYKIYGRKRHNGGVLLDASHYSSAVNEVGFNDFATQPVTGITNVTGRALIYETTIHKPWFLWITLAGVTRTVALVSTAACVRRGEVGKK